MAEPRPTYIVKEFDRIVSNTAYKTLGQTAKARTSCIDDEDFLALQKYLFSSVKDEGKQLYVANGFRASNELYGEIQLKNYVGMIELPNGCRIEILPKIFDGGKELNSDDLKLLLLQMLSRLKDFPSIVNLGDASLDVKRLNLFEVFIRVYLQRTLDLIRRGLRRDYVETEDNCSSIHGRIDIPQQIKKNLFHNERFYVKHDEYILSRPDNRIVKSTLLKLLRTSESEENKLLAKQCLFHFDEVPASADYEADYRSITFDNSNSEYLPLIQWSMVFLRGKSFSIFGGDNRSQALLFPMEKIYERYITFQFSRYIKWINAKQGTKYKVYQQLQAQYLFDLPPRSFSLRPDLVIKDAKPIILDTKWKILTGRDSISQADMYQMYAYSKRHRAEQVILLYPDHPLSNLVKFRRYETTEDSFRTVVDLQFINLFELEQQTKGSPAQILSDDNKFYVMLKGILGNCPADQLFAVTA